MFLFAFLYICVLCSLLSIGQMDKAIEDFVAALQMNSEYEKAKSWHAKVLQEQAVLRASANSNSAATTAADTAATSSNGSKPTDGTTTSSATDTAANSTNGTGDSNVTAISGTTVSGSSSGTVSDDVIINTVPLTPETTNGLKKAHYDESDTAQA
jgi:hypothetical protein